jgi:hypothetical protein
MLNSDGSKRIHGGEKSARLAKLNACCLQASTVPESIHVPESIWHSGWTRIFRIGQKWTLRQKLAQRFAPIAPGGLDKNGYHANTKILGILCCTIQDLHYLLATIHP